MHVPWRTIPHSYRPASERRAYAQPERVWQGRQSLECKALKFVPARLIRRAETGRNRPELKIQLGSRLTRRFAWVLILSHGCVGIRARQPRFRYSVGHA